MKNFGPKFTRRAVLAGSAALGGLAAVGTPLSVLARQAASATASRFDGLAERMRGTVIVPSDDRYDDVRKVWNGMIDRRPGAIARCSGVADVMEAVRFAREHDIPTTIRGGGHNVAGKAVRDGALTIDLAQMHGIRVDA
ncbi:MAG: FAD-dependent oxidoreductase, partial [Gammaproteobacteria bacterium]|nr:FAD-dependent oxidoreductase [Gammaproteobacteria bacterium]